MPAFLVKNLPPALHERLRHAAAKHHRSMNREAIAILEKELEVPEQGDLLPPAAPSKPLSAAWVRETVRAMREGR